MGRTRTVEVEIKPPTPEVWGKQAYSNPTAPLLLIWIRPWCNTWDYNVQIHNNMRWMQKKKPHGNKYPGQKNSFVWGKNLCLQTMRRNVAAKQSFINNKSVQHSSIIKGMCATLWSETCVISIANSETADQDALNFPAVKGSKDGISL